MDDDQLCERLMAVYWAAHRRGVDWPQHVADRAEFFKRFGYHWTARIGSIAPQRPKEV